VLRTPVVLICFNRPEPTRRVLDALRAAQPTSLYVVADGAREGRPGEEALCAQVRDLVTEGVDWPCTVQRRFSETNLGCEGNVELGLDWVFSQTDRAIVLEDDCVPDASFFSYCEELLDRYADEHRVWQVAGNAHGVPAARFGTDSYRFSSWASVWGWATWADRWQRHRAVFPRTHQQPTGDRPVRIEPAVPRTGHLVTRAARSHFADAATSDDNVRHGWDTQWWLTMLTEGGLAVSPSVNMVENVGFGADATHGVSDREMEPARAIAFPLRHPERVAVDTEVERELELLLNRIGGNAARLARRLVKNPRARRLLRRIADSRTAVAVARLASRATDRRTDR
jgi:hypothetical protein